MSNPFNEVRTAVQQAEMQLRAVDESTDSMVRLIVGRLRRVDSFQGIEALKKIKRELQGFNMATGRWKVRK